MLFSLLFLPCLQAFNASEWKVGDIFGTNDYALLTHMGCERLIETQIEPFDCPLGYGERVISSAVDRLNRKCTQWKTGVVRIHLMRDLHMKHAPRLLYVLVSSKTNQIHYAIDTISLKGEFSKWTTPHILNSENYHRLRIEDHEYLHDSVFDSRTSKLYLIIETDDIYRIRRVAVVLISNIFAGKPQFTNVVEKDMHNKTKRRCDFVENPYEHTVSYLVRHNTYVTMFRLPMDDFLTSLVEGKEGTKMVDMSDPNREIVLAHNISMITLAREVDQGNVTDVFYMRRRLHHPYSSIRCEATGTLDFISRRTIAIQGWDYCKLKSERKPLGVNETCPVYFKKSAASFHIPLAIFTVLFARFMNF